MKAISFYAIICAMMLGVGTAMQPSDIKKAEWLIGTWENLPTGQVGKTPRGSIYETWNKASNHEFFGKSYLVKDKDTMVFETIRLVQEQGGLFYIPTVKNQNDDLPIRFAAKTISETQLVFENPQHDFPQVISYTKIGADSLVAEISGIRNGEERKQAFAMKRVR